MTLRVKFSARAAAQIRKAAEWWGDHQPAAIADELRVLAFWHASRKNQPRP